MPMSFDEFVNQVNRAVHAAGTDATLSGPAAGKSASWAQRDRTADMALAPPMNVSLTLAGDAKPETTWYPVDAALVPVVSHRIAAFLKEK